MALHKGRRKKTYFFAEKDAECSKKEKNAKIYIYGEAHPVFFTPFLSPEMHESGFPTMHKTN